MTDFSRVDEHILAAIAAGATTFGEILKELRRPGHAGMPPGLSPGDQDRLLDRRLQALRRAGRARYENRAWAAEDPNQGAAQSKPPREVLEEALQLLGAYRLAPKFGRDRQELQPTLDIEDRIDAFLAAQGRRGPAPAQEQGSAGHG